MDWRYRRYFAVRTRSIFHNYDIQEAKRIHGVRLHPCKYVQTEHIGYTFNEIFPDEQEPRGYHNIMVSCLKEDFSMFYNNWLYKMDYVIEILPRSKHNE